MNKFGGWKASLARVLRENNSVKANGTISSFSTRDKRSKVLFSGFRQLRELGFKLETVESFREKHMVALVREWERRGLSPATIQSNIVSLPQIRDFLGHENAVTTSLYLKSLGYGF